MTTAPTASASPKTVNAVVIERAADGSEVCVRYGCWRTPLRYMRVGESQQTGSGFFTIKINGFYCARCGGGYGGGK